VAHDGVMRGFYMRIYGTRSRGMRRFGALGSHLSERIANRGQILAVTFMIQFSTDASELFVIRPCPFEHSDIETCAVTFMSHAFVMVDI
jgi:hypothetical protein